MNILIPTTPLISPEEATDLVRRRTVLAMQQNIPDMKAYALEWKTLAEEFERAGMLANAELCAARFEQYYPMGGEYIRLIDGQIAELIDVPA